MYSSESYTKFSPSHQSRVFINPCLEFLLSVVWTYDILVNILRIKCLNAKYLNENCRLYLDYHFSFKYYTDCDFIWEINPK